ncbi:hypothetical protein ACQ9BO_07595 [Flavobacterium sp. P21]|uniref:hypothetical protein n=1 Tax=Flavobacterium sp. P21 TaxID=3423948 RepID=UPI003D66877E
MKTIELSRNQLYDLVWSTPLSKLIKQYAISNEGIKKYAGYLKYPYPKVAIG